MKDRVGRNVLISLNEIVELCSEMTPSVVVKDRD